MDVLGFGLENYDAIGRWRTVDGKFPIDVGGTMPDGKSFKTAAEMRNVLLASMPEVSRCLIEKMMTYALGRGMQPYDKRSLEQIQQDTRRRRLPLPDSDLRSGGAARRSNRGAANMPARRKTATAEKPKEIAAK